MAIRRAMQTTPKKRRIPSIIEVGAARRKAGQFSPDSAELDDIGTEERVDLGGELGRRADREVLGKSVAAAEARPAHLSGIFEVGRALPAMPHERGAELGKKVRI